LLIDRLDALGVTVERQTSLVRFEQHGDSIRAVIEKPGGSEDVCEASYLAGCDGAHSTVREMLASGFPGGTYSGLFYVRVNWFSTYLVHHRVATRFCDGRAFLLGDAAHVHSPVGGQGMNTGIGDAVNLAWKLAAVVKGSAGDDLLATYETERIGFARRLVATTDRAFTVVTKQGRVTRRVRTRLVPLIAPPMFRLVADMAGSLVWRGARRRDCRLRRARAPTPPVRVAGRNATRGTAARGDLPRQA
jgi:2-polyprenyl-6-methoxyphenol hydroxylase-like FAD-dependent oxidoreductase